MLTVVQQIYGVKATADIPPQRLDLNRAADEEFSPDKLRAAGERLYTIVITPLISFYKHIARIRSWKEPRRTSAFCAVP